MNDTSSLDKDKLPGERLHLHEGSVTLPVDYEDRTTNVLVPADRDRTPNLSIARDWLQTDEDLDNYVGRQCRELKKRLSGFRLLSQVQAHLGQGEHALHGTRIDSRYKHGAQTIWQQQAVFLIAPRRALIFTATGLNEPTPDNEHLWSTWLASFRLAIHPPDDS